VGGVFLFWFVVMFLVLVFVFFCFLVSVFVLGFFCFVWPRTFSATTRRKSSSLFSFLCRESGRPPPERSRRTRPCP